MPLTELTHNFLQNSEILKKLMATKQELVRIPVDKVASARQAKLNKIKDDLKSIFFEGLDNNSILQTLSSESSQFMPDYPALRETLRVIFSNEADALDEMVVQIQASSQIPRDWIPDEAILSEQYQRPNQQHHYFESVDNNAQSMVLFKELVCACRKVCVLVEQNNATDDEMAYDYAYKR